MTRAFGIKRWAAGNWFVLLLPFLLLASFLFTRTVEWQGEARIAEAVMIFDWCVSVPLLFFLCYRKTMPLGQMLVRLAALTCLGVWIAARLVPPDFQSLLPQLGWARMAGLAVLVLIELRLMVAAFRLVFSNTATADDLTGAGIPPFIARLMLTEARFWRAVWKLLRRR